MNRAHSAKEAQECLSEAVRYFDNITLDLIYGIPGMDEQKWMRNIQIALSYNIPHISSYALTVEPKTALHSLISRGLVASVDEAMAQKHFEILVDVLESAGFKHYEFSNFGKEGYFSRNNTAYWLGTLYLGIGPSDIVMMEKQGAGMLLITVNILIVFEKVLYHHKLKT